MRLWSIDPRYLDAKGLVALWREGLLAQKVLLGLTKGYRHHPQLSRFRVAADPVLAIGFYLDEVTNEAQRRGYRFDRTKIVKSGKCATIDVARGQLGYEWAHLLEKLQRRAAEDYARHSAVTVPDAHPAFRVVPGGVEDWERR